MRELRPFLSLIKNSYIQTVLPDLLSKSRERFVPTNMARTSVHEKGANKRLNPSAYCAVELRRYFYRAGH
jgi:hypothetical protein